MNKRYAVMVDGQLVFNETENWFDKKTVQFVEQKDEESKTLEAFEKKYNVKLKWHKGIGYVLLNDARFACQ